MPSMHIRFHNDEQQRSAITQHDNQTNATPYQLQMKVTRVGITITGTVTSCSGEVSHSYTLTHAQAHNKKRNYNVLTTE